MSRITQSDELHEISVIARDPPVFAVRQAFDAITLEVAYSEQIRLAAMRFRACAMIVASSAGSRRTPARALLEPTRSEPTSWSVST